MPIVLPPSTVLVTGANGFLAVHLITELLEQGYTVRGTVRSLSKGEWIKNKFASFGEKFEYLVVEDITKEGAFDEAIKGVDAVLHTASAVPENWVGTYEILYVPCVKGTESIVKSLQGSRTVKRVVFTSSFTAVWGPHPLGYTYSEVRDWNDTASKLIKEKPHELPGSMLYFAAKTDSERAFWKFYEEHKDQLAWDLVTLTPPYTFGPVIQEVPNASTKMIWKKAFKDNPADQVGQHAGFWIDVRDCAHAHLLSLQKEQAGGERFLITGGAFTWQDVYNELQSLHIPEIPKGVETKDVLDIPNTSKAANTLGMTYRTLGESVRDTIVTLRERGINE
ncbi:NAD(P)-binding protein [Calocera cornea HHB12733]|uniref:NAD(P)-binding protein n=1 Tax=Calocera cornea HHB12733 TaxID=1353952 RepID=A0A165CHQ5_9BASI|nr:NAD(P)-binding protein [Calocera cornea HHB12733]